MTLDRLPGPIRRWLYAGGTRQDRLRDPDAVAAALDRRHRLGIPQPVDLLFISATYHHLPDPQKYFANARAHLRPGARVAILDSRRDRGYWFGLFEVGLITDEFPDEKLS